MGIKAHLIPVPRNSRHISESLELRPVHRIEQKIPVPGLLQVAQDIGNVQIGILTDTGPAPVPVSKVLNHIHGHMLIKTQGLVVPVESRIRDVGRGHRHRMAQPNPVPIEVGMGHDILQRIGLFVVCEIIQVPGQIPMRYYMLKADIGVLGQEHHVPG